jgi:hypothetical protein
MIAIEGSGVPGVFTGRSVTERVINFAAFENIRFRGRRVALDITLDNVLSNRVLADLFRGRTNFGVTRGGADLIHEDVQHRMATLRPLPTRLPGLVNVIDLDEPIVHRALTGIYTGNAGPVADDALSPSSQPQPDRRTSLSRPVRRSQRDLTRTPN